MKYSLRAKLSISYIMVAMISVAILSILSNVVLNNQFQSYIKKNIDKKNTDLVQIITEQYAKSKEWQYFALEDIGVRAINDGLIIRVVDADNTTIWDAMEHNHGLCLEMLEDMAQNMSRKYPEIKGEFQENNYSIFFENTRVGKVYIGYYGPFYLNESDLEFIDTLNRVLVVISVFVLLLALGIGYYMAKRISKPLSRVIKSTHLISEGYYHDRVLEETNIKEIMELMDSVNHLAETLENQEQLRKRLTGDVAHELRTPLATLQSHMEAMIDGIWEPSANRLQSCHDEILRINRLIGQLEKLSKYDRDVQTLDMAQFDLSLVLTAILRQFEKEFFDKDLRVEFEYSPVKVIADQDKISQVMYNLISNASKYTKEHGRIHIRIVDLGDNAEFSIEDNGIGISEMDLPHVFERFYRADESRTRATGGAGIGLTIVKSIIDVHQGTVHVESELDHGTKVTFTLPKAGLSL